MSLSAATVALPSGICPRCFGRGHLADPESESGRTTCTDCVRLQPASLPPYDVWVIWHEHTPRESADCIGRSSTEKEAWKVAGDHARKCRAAIASGQVPPDHFDEMAIRICDEAGDGKSLLILDSDEQWSDEHLTVEGNR